ncbi:MAG TPA: purine nucleoside phosphorylase DeoD-type, partial [Bacilli bacterium]|nr:purine nucleoside phosphorylase DeoD-type [Bacilli bacterium]
DLVLADSAYSESTFGKIIDQNTPKIIKASEELTNKIDTTAQNLNLSIKKGMIYTSDIFDVYFDISYILNGKDLLASEMESYGLFFIANYLKKEASTILTVVDSKFEDKIISPEDREKSLNDMIKLALESI